MVSFCNIIFNTNIIEQRLVYPSPVYPAKDGCKKKRENDASVSHYGANIINGIANGNQNGEGKEKAETDKDDRVAFIALFSLEKQENKE